VVVSWLLQGSARIGFSVFPTTDLWNLDQAGEKFRYHQPSIYLLKMSEKNNQAQSNKRDFSSTEPSDLDSKEEQPPSKRQK
jgi:hypothetical protein